MSREYHLSQNEQLPIPLRASKSAIIAHGEKIRRDVKLRHGFDLAALFELNDGWIQSEGALNSTMRALEYRPDGSFTIHLSSLRSGLSNNMIAAREFGHVALHSEDFKREHPGKTMVVPKSIPEDDEDLLRCKWEATWFARGLLMPEAEFTSEVEKNGLSDAAQYFGVSKLAAEERYEEILLAQSDMEPTPEPA